MRKASASVEKTSRPRGAVAPASKSRLKKASASPLSKSSGRNNGAERPVKAALRESRSGDRRGAERVVHGGRTPAVNSAAAASRGKYVYCIIESGDPLRFGPIGIGADPSEVYTVHYKNLAAVVSDAPLEVLDSTRENVLAHERVNETVMREHTVIPMSFGTIFKTREDIVELLRSAAEAFGDVLNKMQNKLEFGLKVLWDRDQAIREV